MAPVVPSDVPSTLRAGDSLHFTATFPDYPVSEGWSLSYVLRGIGQLDTSATEITAGDTGVDWDVLIAADRTQVLDAGTYTWFAVMTGSGDTDGLRNIVAEGRIVVTANPLDADAGDFRAQCEKDLEVVQAALASRLTDDMQSYMIGGRQVVLIPIRELYAIETRLKRQVWKLQHPGESFPKIRLVFRGTT